MSLVSLKRGRVRSLGLVAVATTSALALALFVNAPVGLLAVPAPPQVAVGDAGVEGPILAVDEVSQTVNVMGITVNVLPTTTITSPTATLTFADLLGASFAGRPDPGFIGGTAIVGVGTSTPDGSVDAADLFVETAENVILGPVTENTIPPGGSLGDPGTSFKILGVAIEPTNDARLPLTAVVQGFEVDMSTVPVGTLGAAEGHLGMDGVFYVHTVQVEQGEVLGDPNQTSIFLARCKSTGRLEVRGTSSTPGTVTMLGVVETVLFDPLIGSGEFRFKIQPVPGGVCPTTVTVFNSNGSQASFPVTING